MQKDLTRRELVLELPVRCPHAVEPSQSRSAESTLSCAPCEWQGSLDALKTHLSVCNNDRARAQCNHCGSFVVQKDLPAHSARCAKKKVVCTLCKKRVAVSELAEHVVGCEDLQLACPFLCGVRVRTAEMAAHIHQCGNVPTRCHHHQYGCTAVIRATEMDRHVSSCEYASCHPLFRRCKALEGANLALRSQVLSGASTEIDLLGQASFAEFETTAGVLDMTIDHTRSPACERGEGSEPDATPSRERPGRFVWRISDFKLRTERYIESPSFSDACGDRWTCRVYPRGDGNTHGFITFGAYKNTDTLSKYSVEIVNVAPTKSMFRSIAPTQSRWRSAGWGWRRLIRRERVLEGGFLFNGTLVVTVQVQAAHEL